MTDHHGWIAAVFFGGLCVLSFLWTLCAAPGFKAKGKHVLLTGASRLSPSSPQWRGANNESVSDGFTGGTTGLGLAVAKKYAKAGAKVRSRLSVSWYLGCSLTSCLLRPSYRWSVAPWSVLRALVLPSRY